MFRLPVDVVELHALVHVFRFVGEVELGHVLLELAFPRLCHAGADLLGGGGEDLRLRLHAALRVVAHDLDDEFPWLLFALEFELAEERLADRGRTEGLHELDGLDFLSVALILRLVDHRHEVRLHDLARNRRERALHVRERVRIVAHDVSREALHHLLEERTRALQNCARELVDCRLLRRDELLALEPREVEGLRILHGRRKARTLVGLAEQGEVAGNHLAEESDLSRRIGVRGSVENGVESLVFQLVLELVRREVLVGIADDAALRVDVGVPDLEDIIDEKLDVLAALVRHRKDEVVELGEFRAGKFGEVLQE